MVSGLSKKSETIYQCELCGFGYSDLETAERCQANCDTHASCSGEIMRNAVYRQETKVMPSYYSDYRVSD